MEEILASIRRIIADDGALPEPAPRSRPPEAPAARVDADRRVPEPQLAPVPRAPAPAARLPQDSVAAQQPRAKAPPPFRDHAPVAPQENAHQENAHQEIAEQEADDLDLDEAGFEPEPPPLVRGRPQGRFAPSRLMDEERMHAAPLPDPRPEPEFAPRVYGMRPAEPAMAERRRWDTAAPPRPPVDHRPERVVRDDAAPPMAPRPSMRPLEPERLMERERFREDERLREPEQPARPLRQEVGTEPRFAAEPAYRPAVRSAGSLPPVRPAAPLRPSPEASARPAAGNRGNVEAFERSLAEARAALNESLPSAKPTQAQAAPAETVPPSVTSQPNEPRVPLPRRDLLSPAVDAAVAAAFQSLGDLVLPQHERTVEDLVKEILRPMLKEWLNQNLAGIVERLVRAEIERVTANLR